jgi:hypothetical protein
MNNPSQTPVSSKYGAPMGRSNSPLFILGKRRDNGPVELHNVVIDSQGYDGGGAYWGKGTQLWCGLTDEHCEYFRSPSLQTAIVELMDNGVNQFDIQFVEQTWNLYWHAFDCPTNSDNCGSAPSENADSCTCDCGEHIEADRIYGTEVEVQRPITGCY